MHRFPADLSRRVQRLDAIGLGEGDLQEHSRICSRHFLNGDTSTLPSLTIGKRFASPKKLLDRGKRALKRRSLSPLFQPPPVKRPSLTSPCSSSHSVTPISVQSDVTEESDTASDAFCLSTSTSDTMFDLSSGGSNVALTARIEALEAEVQHLKKELGTVYSAAKPFRIEDIAANDSHIRFYTGFVSYEVLIEFFHFLGPSVHNLVYWGSSESKSGHTRKKKLDALKGSRT